MPLDAAIASKIIDLYKVMQQFTELYVL